MQGLAWALIQFGFDEGEASLALIEEVGSLGEVLADESVEVFDAAFLLGVVGLARRVSPLHMMMFSGAGSRARAR
ncbi:hypothetical protein [Cerasicoccus arenae]|uniref:Uncharacterized protein n=1 Tax=Cerasicoccus arenae TaxID=424488 RepID=A0A8J3DAM9_9BACT|nr:hypothetical protein GCM10007047_09610 [Cerasicoccus arenae]